MKLDVRGEVCPYPMLKAVEAMQKLKGREEVVVITDHAPCLETIPPQARRFGYAYSVRETGSPEWTITLSPQGPGR
ncbi:MAG: sulfurtransferase TusA family protein [Chloroflexi bacterium]|nr:sulfurtransferase TusA family protein [Chloroflexota bacterium]